MERYIFKRILWMIPVVLCVVILIFTLMSFVPGDPASIILGSNATADQVANLRANLGLDQPFMFRLLTYMRHLFLNFDMGNSYITKISVSTDIISRFPPTLALCSVCIVVSMLIGIPLGVIAALKQDTIFDRLAIFFALVGVSIPSFWMALMMVILFSVKLGLLPASGSGGIQYFIMPVISMALGGIAEQARQSRSSMLQVMRSDYITTARSKGITKREVVLKHALPNALIPVITCAGGSFGALLGMTMITEQVFTIPGLGTYMINAVNNRDIPAVEGSVIVLAVAFSIIMLLTDLAFAFVDPRIKAQYAGKKKRRNEKNA